MDIVFKNLPCYILYCSGYIISTADCRHALYTQYLGDFKFESIVQSSPVQYSIGERWRPTILIQHSILCKASSSSRQQMNYAMRH